MWHLRKVLFAYFIRRRRTFVTRNRHIFNRHICKKHNCERYISRICFAEGEILCTRTRHICDRHFYERRICERHISNISSPKENYFYTPKAHFAQSAFVKIGCTQKAHFAQGTFNKLVHAQRKFRIRHFFFFCRRPRKTFSHATVTFRNRRIYKIMFTGQRHIPPLRNHP